MGLFSDWTEKQIGIIRGLKGRSVVGFVATEIAFRGGDGADDGPPQFEDRSLPFMQVCPLYLNLDSDQTFRFITYQDDEFWGICFESQLNAWEPELDAGSSDSLFRTRKLDGFPTGQVQSVEVHLDDDGQIAEVLLNISGDPILLVAGEVHERQDGMLSDNQ